MRIIIISLFFVSSFVCGCADPNASFELDPLSGDWSETYVWDGSLINIQPPEYLHDKTIPRTTTLQFAGDSITITILPPYRIFSKTRNSDNLISSGDTLLTGSYSYRGSMIYIHLYNNKDIDPLDFPHPFTFNVAHDSLFLSVFGADEYNNSFIWGNSYLKTSGVFTRNE